MGGGSLMVKGFTTTSSSDSISVRSSTSTRIITGRSLMPSNKRFFASPNVAATFKISIQQPSFISSRQYYITKYSRKGFQSFSTMRDNDVNTSASNTSSSSSTSSSASSKTNVKSVLSMENTLDSSSTLFINQPSLQKQLQRQQQQQQPPMKINLLTIHQSELEELLISWNQPKYRAKQILTWIHSKGVTSFSSMTNLPKSLIDILTQHATIGTLQLEVEAQSKDGTKKRAYRLWDGQLIESVLMPYEDGRQTACISSQAGCAMGCVFCATGQMGFARQLTADEIFEQVARFAMELKGENQRLSNVVMMGMGEPLANYRNVMEAIRRMNDELGIGARKITVSTVGVVPNIKKLMQEDIQVRLAVSLHCSSDKERSELLPANKRYGGLDELMNTIREYIDTTNRRVTLEWALIENENDTPEVARQLGQLLSRFRIRKDMVHINLIPLNPTGGYKGGPSGRKNVEGFVNVLDKEFGIKATPRVRRGIDIDAGCGQLKASVKRKEAEMALAAVPSDSSELDIVSEDGLVDPKEISIEALYKDQIHKANNLKQGSVVEFAIHDAVDLDTEEEFEDEEYENDLDRKEAERLINLVKMSSQEVKGPGPSPSDDECLPPVVGATTSIIDEEAITKSKKRRKKILKNLKSIGKLKDMLKNGVKLNDEQLEKISKEREFQLELESVEHNLQ